MEIRLTYFKIGALICFVVIGIDVYFVMQSLGELVTLYPSAGAFTELAGRFIDPAASVALGWNYWYLVRHSPFFSWVFHHVQKMSFTQSAQEPSELTREFS